jgi:hypothetical protein
LSTAVRIFCGQGEVPIFVDGAITAQSDHGLSFLCSTGASALKPGAKVVLSIDGVSEKRTGTITEILPKSDGRFGVEFEDIARHSPDKRDYPRLCAGIPIQYMPGDAEQAELWASGGEVQGDWLSPDPYMNFSVGGVRFDVTETLCVNDRVLIEMKINADAAAWRCTARVVRIFEVSPDSSAVASVAVSFEHLPPGALEALSALTLQVQSSLL